MMMMMMVTGRGWCRWCESPPAAVIRGVLQDPHPSLRFDQGTQMEPNNHDEGCMSLLQSGGWGGEGGQTTEWYKPVAQGKKSALMEVNQWLTEWRLETAVSFVARWDWKALLFYLLNTFCTTLTYLTVICGSTINVKTAFRLSRVVFPPHLIYRWIC